MTMLPLLFRFGPWAAIALLLTLTFALLERNKNKQWEIETMTRQIEINDSNLKATQADCQLRETALSNELAHQKATATRVGAARKGVKGNAGDTAGVRAGRVLDQLRGSATANGS